MKEYYTMCTKSRSVHIIIAKNHYQAFERAIKWFGNHQIKVLKVSPL